MSKKLVCLFLLCNDQSHNPTCSWTYCGSDLIEFKRIGTLSLVELHKIPTVMDHLDKEFTRSFQFHMHCKNLLYFPYVHFRKTLNRYCCNNVSEELILQ